MYAAGASARVIIFQWSAVATEGCTEQVLGVVRRWVHTDLIELGWPPGRIFRAAGQRGSMTIEHHFDDMPGFERAWEVLLNSEKAPELWAELQPYLVDDNVDRQLYSVSYARDRSR